MIFGFAILATALLLSAVAAWYSVAGLTAIFSAATIPVIIMGGSLELGKIVATVWLHNNWKRAGIVFKLYLIPAIAFLMILTSMGIFGYLSKAHSDQSLVSGDVVGKIAIYDEKIRTERENIDANRKALKQLDESVDQVMGRSSDEKGAEKAVAIRRAQQKERGRLAQDIADSQKRIAGLNEERAPIAAEVRKVEAEVGPIKYIAAFIYGETSEGILEKAVTWVIVILIVVFDPLAVILLLSSQVSFQNFRERKSLANYEPDDGPLTDQQIEQIRELAEGNNPQEPVDVVDGHTIVTESLEEKSILAQHPYLTKGFSHFENLKPMVHTPDKPVLEEPVVEEPAVVEVPKEESLFVQNEEQKESNLWTSTTNAESLTPEAYMKALQERFDLEPRIAKLATMVKTGRMDISTVPDELKEAVQRKMQ